MTAPPTPTGIVRCSPRKSTAVMTAKIGAVHDTAQGAFQATGNPLDVMIDGPGYFSVETPEGGVAYTRAGMLKVAESGDLVEATTTRA